MLGGTAALLETNPSQGKFTMEKIHIEAMQFNGEDAE